MKLKQIEVYEYFYKDNDNFDFSNYPDNSYFYDEANKMVIGKMKDENEGFQFLNLFD